MVHAALLRLGLAFDLDDIERSAFGSFFLAQKKNISFFFQNESLELDRPTANLTHFVQRRDNIFDEKQTMTTKLMKLNRHFDLGAMYALKHIVDIES